LVGFGQRLHNGRGFLDASASGPRAPTRPSDHAPPGLRKEIDDKHGRPVPTEQAKALAEGTWDQALTKGDLAQLLALEPSEVGRYPHDVRQRRGGGEYHLFSADTVLNVFDNHGGLQGLAKRIADKKSKARHKDEKKAQEAARERAARLNRGLAAIGLAPREDSYW
jgi:hypothetical protein